MADKGLLDYWRDGGYRLAGDQLVVEVVSRRLRTDGPGEGRKALNGPSVMVVGAKFLGDDIDEGRSSLNAQVVTVAGEKFAGSGVSGDLCPRIGEMGGDAKLLDGDVDEGHPFLNARVETVVDAKSQSTVRSVMEVDESLPGGDVNDGLDRLNDQLRRVAAEMLLGDDVNEGSYPLYSEMGGPWPLLDGNEIDVSHQIAGRRESLPTTAPTTHLI